jgi:hypothetical protein
MSGRLPRTLKSLNGFFSTAREPVFEELYGEYRVKILTGFPDFSWCNHRKVFYGKEGKGYGYNLMFSGWRWGYFDLRATPDPHDAVLIDYDKKENPFFWRPIRDYIKCLQKNTLYLGQFRYELNRKEKFIGYFSLSRKQQID